MPVRGTAPSWLMRTPDSSGWHWLPQPIFGPPLPAARSHSCDPKHSCGSFFKSQEGELQTVWKMIKSGKLFKNNLNSFVKCLLPQSSDESHGGLFVWSSVPWPGRAGGCAGGQQLAEGVIPWPTPCSRVEQEQQVMRYPTPLLLVGWVGLEVTDAESHWRDFAGRSEKGTLWIMLWTWSSGHLFSHLCHRVPTCPWARHAVYPALISPVRNGGWLSSSTVLWGSVELAVTIEMRDLNRIWNLLKESWKPDSVTKRASWLWLCCGGQLQQVVKLSQ